MEAVVEAGKRGQYERKAFYGRVGNGPREA